MSFDEIFSAYYTLYRAEASIPTSTDDEYKIAIPLANEAINRWANYDNTFWSQLFDTFQNSGDGTTITTGTTQYDGPGDMKEAGGIVKIVDSNNNTVRTYQIIEPQEAQFKIDRGQYAYFTGDPNNGFTLNLNPAPDSAINGMNIDFVYYKTPTLIATGSDVPDMSNPYFIVHRMLSNRFRASRNPYAPSALRDSEDMLKIMQMENMSGTWANPWRLQDNSGAAFGSSQPGSWSW
jgi:hypothetical protein